MHSVVDLVGLELTTKLLRNRFRVRPTPLVELPSISPGVLLLSKRPNITARGRRQRRYATQHSTSCIHQRYTVLRGDSSRTQVDVAHHPECQSRNHSRTAKHDRYYDSAEQNHS